MHQKRGGREGRGSMITFLPKDTVNLIIDLIKCEIKSRIAAEINSAGMYFIQLDTTQDISTKDQ